MGVELRERYGAWALVTGASSGIGRSLAHGLARGGMNVVVLSDEADELERVADELRARHGVDARTCCVDLARDDFLDAVRAATDGIDVSVLVNDASFGRIGPFLANPLEAYETMLRVNTRAYVALTHEFLPGIVEANRGALVFVASINALSPIGNSAVYTATKAFELYLGGALWWELRDTPVDVLVVLPGPTRTGFQAKAGTQVASWAMEPDEVAEGALAALGGERVTFVPGERNQEIAAQAAALTLEQRILAASQLLNETLAR